MNISVAELRAVANQLFDHLEVRQGEQLEIATDYYWAIPRATRNDPTATPHDLTIGQLSDDLRELRRILNHESEPINYALVWLAAVLREVGETCAG